MNSKGDKYGYIVNLTYGYNFRYQRNKFPNAWYSVMEGLGFYLLYYSIALRNFRIHPTNGL